VTLNVVLRSGAFELDRRANQREVKVPIIKNYGFLWERKYIYRGSGGDGNAGHLKGTKNGQETDFREQIGVYVLYDRNQHIVYVGQAGNGNATLFSRLKNHMDGELWNRWEYFTWIGFRDVNVTGRLSDMQCVDSNVSGLTYSDALNEIEGILIEVIEPKLNKQGGRWKSAAEYYQFIDGKVEEITNQHLKEELSRLHRKLEQIGV